MDEGKPNCCGKPCQPVKRQYGRIGFWVSKEGVRWWVGSVVVFFRCRVCGHLGVPFMSDWDDSYMKDMDRVRAEGIAFDELLMAVVA